MSNEPEVVTMKEGRGDLRRGPVPEDAPPGGITLENVAVHAGKFPLGKVFYTEGAWRSMFCAVFNEDNADAISRYQSHSYSAFGVLQAIVERHARGVWGESLDPEDKQANDEALNAGTGRILSTHEVFGTRYWVITESDRSRTTVLLPKEY